MRQYIVYVFIKRDHTSLYEKHTYRYDTRKEAKRAAKTFELKLAREILDVYGHIVDYIVFV